MVLAELWRRRQYDKGFEEGYRRGYEEGFKQGYAEGVKIRAERANRQYIEKVRAWAAARGIPANELPEFCRLPEFDEQPSELDGQSHGR